VFAPVAAPGATQGPGADSSTTLVAAAAWVPTRSAAVAPLRRTISLDLKDADIRDVLLTFSKLARLNMVIDPDVRGSVTVRDRVHDKTVILHAGEQYLARGPRIKTP